EQDHPVETVGATDVGDNVEWEPGDHRFQPHVEACAEEPRRTRRPAPPPRKASRVRKVVENGYFPAGREDACDFLEDRLASGADAEDEVEDNSRCRSPTDWQVPAVAHHVVWRS